VTFDEIPDSGKISLRPNNPKPKEEGMVVFFTIIERTETEVRAAMTCYLNDADDGKVEEKIFGRTEWDELCKMMDGDTSFKVELNGIEKAVKRL